MAVAVVPQHSQSQEQEANAIEEEMAQVCGALNTTTGRLVSLDRSGPRDRGLRGHWHPLPRAVGGVEVRRLRRSGPAVVAMARRMPELPETASALQAGELSEEQVAVLCGRAPAYADAEVATLARHTTVAQLVRTLRRYTWAPDPDEKEKEKDKPEEPEEARRVDFGTTEEGAWRLSALLPPDEGAVVERALDAARRALADEAQVQRPTWADALLAMADRSLGATARRPAPSGPSPGGGARARRRARPQCPRS